MPPTASADAVTEIVAVEIVHVIITDDIVGDHIRINISHLLVL